MLSISQRKSNLTVQSPGYFKHYSSCEPLRICHIFYKRAFRRSATRGLKRLTWAIGLVIPRSSWKNTFAIRNAHYTKETYTVSPEFDFSFIQQTFLKHMCAGDTVSVEPGPWESLGRQTEPTGSSKVFGAEHLSQPRETWERQCQRPSQLSLTASTAQASGWGRKRDGRHGKNEKLEKPVALYAAHPAFLWRGPDLLIWPMV